MKNSTIVFYKWWKKIALCKILSLKEDVCKNKLKTIILSVSLSTYFANFA